MSTQEEIEYLIKLKENQINRAKLKLQDLSKELLELHTKCTHKNLVPKNKYCSGSYCDKALTTYWDECTVCKKSFNSRDVYHNFYG